MSYPPISELFNLPSTFDDTSSVSGRIGIWRGDNRNYYEPLFNQKDIDDFVRNMKTHEHEFYVLTVENVRTHFWKSEKAQNVASLLI